MPSPTDDVDEEDYSLPLVTFQGTPVAGLETTFQTLATTRNSAAVELLVPALDSDHAEVREGALRALLQRSESAGHLAILSRWHSFGEWWKSIVAEHRGPLSWAVRDAIVSPEESLFHAGCDVAQRLGEYDLITVLLSVAEDKPGPRVATAAEAVVGLAEQLYSELNRQRDYKIRRDPELARQHMLEALEPSLKRFDKHQRHEILEAFLLLAQRNNATLKRILHDPSERCFQAVIQALTISQRPGVMRLTLNFLEDPLTPLAALQVVARRSDRAFLGYLLPRLLQPTELVRKSLRRMELIPWLVDAPQMLLDFDEDEQRAAVQFATGSGMNRLDVFEVLRYLLVHGKPGGRQAASAALQEFKGAAANELALRALEDSDPGVQANILRQLRERGIPGAMARLLEHLDSPHAIVQDAIRSSLSEFTFDRYLASFEMLDSEVRRSTGALVKKLDGNTVPSVLRELGSPSRTRRLKALEMASALDVLPDVEEAVLELLQENDHFVRTEAVRSLAGCNTANARRALREALLDRHTAVQEAAEISLQKLTRGPAALTDSGHPSAHP